ncbi:MAG: hypothetical protein CL677_10150, partial [Bdellovibrionaceae bacterium]|nr:hypothetical protein [Pseudobdellovibrionaceae bacterium]
MRRYWIDKSQIESECVEFSGDQLHHLRDVCRLQVGSKFEVLFEDSKAHFVEMTEVDKKHARAKILETRVIPALPAPAINLAISLPRFQKMDTIVEKAVELGVGQITPFVSDFSFVKSLSKVSPNKKERWSKIVKSATQQTGRGSLMPVSEPVTFEVLLAGLNRVEGAKCLFLYEGQGEISLKKALEGLQREKVDEIWLIIGSEGGFSDQEVDMMRERSHSPVTLGDQV